jgi:hypothetical protein
MRKWVSGLALVVAAVVGRVERVQANEAHNRWLKVPNEERNATWTKFMEASGKNCVVKENFFQGMTKEDQAIWDVRCASGKAFAVMIEPDAVGSTKVLDCSVLKSLSAGECFKKFDK